ncbi:hypothetical protein H5410_026220 [Solanum commersonii]|uniref:NB-ARC domain-containing protein n=1 Tax=Solanum commersonii TaxID=4109 RepID=A0A9J5YY55_SOLCO|nr:hypothetical protein H5410_026220 [Solanum commersonii]
MAENGIEVVLDHLKKIKCGGNMNSVKIDQIETLEMELRFFRTFINYSDTLVPSVFFMVKMKKKAQLIEVMFYSVHGETKTTTYLNVERLVSQLRECVEGNTSSRLNYELDDFHLLEYMDYLNKNLNDALRYLVKSGREDEDDADLKENEDDTDKDLEEDGDDTFCFEIKPPYLLFLVVLVELEMKKIFLIFWCILEIKKPKKFTTDVSAQNIDDVIEFLLVFLGEVPNDVINEKREDTNKILEKIEDLKARVETYYKSLKFIPSHEFPTVGGLSFVDSLLRKLNEMLKSETGLGFMMKPHIGILEKELSSLTYVFKDAAKKYTVSLAYEAEVAIDFILVQYNVLEHFFCSLPGIIKEIEHIYTEVTKMWSKNLSVRPYSVVELSKHLPIEYSNLVNDEEIVGFEKAEETLYNNVSIVHHFDVRAWCIISQTYNRRELLQVIFSQVTGSKDNGDKDDVLAKLLRRSLMSKRYLIVLDDMWDCMAWDDLRLCFPDDGNRSRIVITTRLEKVDAHVMHHIDPYFLPFLTPEESCQLLQKKVFQQEGCPPKLQNVSLALAKRCKGLSLVVILAAGIIKRNKVNESWWREVKKALFSYLDCETEDYSRASMLLSYDNLPDYLKPCLLYMGMFPEDVSIRVSKLISLWIAEGFIQNSESGRLMEEEAEGYLMDLIHSNVKSREEKFMLVVKANRYQFQPYDWNESQVSFSFNNERSKFASLRSKTRTKTFYQHLRSLIMTNGVGYEWNPFRDDVYQLILVKVLDLSSHSVALLLSAQLQPLIHLKISSAPSGNFISELLPANFWKMEKLRHVEISSAEFDLENNKQGIFEECSKLENLRTLGNVVFPIDQVDSLDVLSRRCPNLQELHISVNRDNDSAEICLKLESFKQLHILRLNYIKSSQAVSKLQLPSNLKKLVLYKIHIESMIPVIAGLPNLEYLQLAAGDLIQSKEWGLEDITLHKLKLLKLVSLGISLWDASEESFPQLKTLVIKRCDELEEIPISFAYISTLKLIQLIQCKNKFLEASAERIKEEVEAIEGYDCLNLIIMEVIAVMTDGRVDRSVECTSTLNNGGVLVKNSMLKKAKKPKVTVAEAATMIDNSDLSVFLVDISPFNRVKRSFGGSKEGTTGNSFEFSALKLSSSRCWFYPFNLAKKSFCGTKEGAARRWLSHSTMQRYHLVELKKVMKVVEIVRRRTQIKRMDLHATFMEAVQQLGEGVEIEEIGNPTTEPFNTAKKSFGGTKEGTASG